MASVSTLAYPAPTQKRISARHYSQNGKCRVAGQSRVGLGAGLGRQRRIRVRHYFHNGECSVVHCWAGEGMAWVKVTGETEVCTHDKMLA